MEFYNEGGIATFKKGDWAKRKKKNQMKEAKRRYDEGDRSSYVMKKYGHTQTETPYDKKYTNLTKAQRQSNKQRTGSETGFDPYRKSNVIPYVDTTNMDAKDAYRINSAWRKQQKVNQWLDDREDRRNEMAYRVYSDDPTLDKKEFQKQIKGYSDGLFGLNVAGNEHTTLNPVTGERERDRLRLGLGSNDYFDYMQRLQNLNPKKMDTINPWGSGTTMRNLITKGVGKNLKYGVDQLGKGYNWLKENTGNFGQMIDDFDSIPGNALKKMGVITPIDDKLIEINKNLKGDVNETIEEVINPEADIADYVKRRGYIPGETTFTEADEIFNQSEPSSLLAEIWNTGSDGDPDQIDEDIVYDPTQDDRKRKIEFIKEATGGNITANAYSKEVIDNLYKKIKQQVGRGISKDIAEDLAPGVIDYTQIAPAAASTVLSGDPEEIKQLRENIWNAPVGSETTSFNVGNIGNAQLNPFRNYENAYIRSLLPFRQPDTVVGSSEFDTGGRFDVDTIFDSSAYDGLTEDQKIKLEEGINTPISSTWNQTYAPFADGGYLEKYDDGGYANMSTYEKLKAIADSHYG